MTEFVVVIPARYASERLPGKPLRELLGKPMIEHVWRRATTSPAREVVIATDDERIAERAEQFGATVCMTAASHPSGTDRIAEVADICDWSDDDVVVNVQGDEPLMPAPLITQCAALLDDPAADIGTLASPFDDARDHARPDVVKALVDVDGFALYFSRAAIPYSRGASTDELAVTTALRHHGIYAYRCGVLRALVAAPAASLERCERLEQLRALHLGMTIRVGIPSAPPGPGVDTADDLSRVEALLAAALDGSDASARS
ncbi:MAG: 3-deoxy-manno-octulosonate cytidylyltransferase [Woeseiaceae bacterium]|nr:3-deoxy-manno-octulosonate cytidylyltransferase [Woeseiaceae bacterium]